MGSWGLGPFENDTACDFTNGVVYNRDFYEVRNVLRHITRLPLTSYLEVDDCCEGLVAAEIVAALNGFPSPDLPENLAVTLTEFQPNFRNGDTELALHAVKRIRSNSELCELAEGQNEWFSLVDKLLRRLEAPTHPITFPKKKVKKVIPTKSGDIILVPFDTSLYGIGKVLRISERIKHLMIFGLYIGLQKEKIAPDQLTDIPDQIEYVWIDPIEEGRWYIVDNRPITSAEMELLPADDIGRVEGIPLSPPIPIENDLRRLNKLRG
jgi:hypothetical protein